MDPISIATSIVGLFNVGKQCFNFFSDVKNADTKARAKLLEVEIQGHRFGNWGYYWEIGSDEAVSRKLVKFFGDNPHKAAGVSKALTTVAELLSDKKVLERYGIMLTPRNGRLGGGNPQNRRSPSPSSRKKLAALRERLGILQSCRWVLRDCDNIQELYLALRSRNDDLNGFCPEGAYDAMKMASVFRQLADLNGMRDLASAMGRLNLQNGDAESNTNELLQDLAELKARASETELTEAQSESLLNLDRDEFDYLSSNVDSTMALWKREQQFVFIEFKDYINDNGFKDKDIQDDILKLGRLIRNPRTPSRLRTMRCLGLFKKSEKGYIGFVYALPDHLSSVPRPFGQVTYAHMQDVRRPHLLSTSLKYAPMPPLGIRFDLARDLVRSVMLLHASGWLHKNIRPDSVMFFPPNRKPLTRDLIDFNHAILMGYGYSRLHTTPQNQKPERDGMLVTNYNQAKNIKLDSYHHPDKRQNPKWRYQHAYDIYSLGLVLLEIGLWRSVAPLDDGDPYETRDKILGLLPKLEGLCGEVHADVVGKCLKMESQTSEAGSQRQREMTLRMYTDLGRCSA